VTDYEIACERLAALARAALDVDVDLIERTLAEPWALSSVPMSDDDRRAWETHYGLQELANATKHFRNRCRSIVSVVGA
jgi:hypothetical protein